MNETDIEDLLSQMKALLKPILRKSGSVFYSGSKMLDSPSRYYLMGLNPGGKPESPEEAKIEESLVSWKGEAPNWSAYMDQDWGKGHRQGVCKFCEGCLRVESARDVFSANAIFERTEKGTHLSKDPERDRICWQVHQLLFSRIQPEYIICLGHGSASSFQWLKERLNVAVRPHEHSSQPEKENERRFYIRWFERDQIQVKVLGLERLVRVIGVPHPSWFGLGSDKFTKEWNALSPLSSAPLKGKP